MSFCGSVRVCVVVADDEFANGAVGATVEDDGFDGYVEKTDLYCVAVPAKLDLT